MFSPQALKWGYQISLQERLFLDYKKRRKDKTLDPNLILLTENYRSNEKVLQFSSDMFYGGKLSSGSVQPLHPRLGPIVFYSAFGKEEIEQSHSSYRNLAEVNEVVKRVKELTDSWPEAEWGPKDLKQVAVVSSYRYQVLKVNRELYKKDKSFMQHCGYFKVNHEYLKYLINFVFFRLGQFEMGLGKLV